MTDPAKPPPIKGGRRIVRTAVCAKCGFVIADNVPYIPPTEKDPRP